MLKIIFFLNTIINSGVICYISKRVLPDKTKTLKTTILIKTKVYVTEAAVTRRKSCYMPATFFKGRLYHGRVLGITRNSLEQLSFRSPLKGFFKNY